MRFFFLAEGKKIEKFGIFERNSPKPKVTNPTQPKQQKN